MAGNEHVIIRGIMFSFCGIIPTYFLLKIFYLTFYRCHFSCLEKMLLFVLIIAIVAIVGFTCILLLANADVAMNNFHRE